MPTVNEMSGGGGWRGSGGGGGPWGQGPRNTGGGGNNNGGGGGTPDLEEILRRGQDRLRRVFPRRGTGTGGGFSPLLVIGIVIVVLAFVGYNFFTFRVEPDQQGVVLRFGEPNRTVGPGLNFRLPAPIETVFTPSVQQLNEVTVGRVYTNAAGTAFRDVPEESLMLTAEGNIVDVAFSVFWRVDIANPQAYLFSLLNPEGTVKAAAESAMREVVGRSQLTSILVTERRAAIGDEARDLTQQILDSYNAGINITDIQILKVDPPPQVIDAYRDIDTAGQNRVARENEATAYANRVVPEARGEAARIVEEANAYRDRTVAEAQGQADRFLQVYAAYREAPEVIRERIYLETMAGILAGTNKVIMPAADANILPYLPLQGLTPGAAR
ncbi:MAG: FtsH protease activity modulator HflK [Bauldia sp.]|jgi:membrane protease subunit HflK|nr:FtsH protease activity modulator HflK [Bauldia sp.]